MATHLCKTCNVHHPIDAFELVQLKDGTSKPRSECRAARAAKRKANSAASVKRKPSEVPMPEACIGCRKSHPEVKFQFRTDIAEGGWRSTCNECFNAKGYYTDYRNRQREMDEEAYLARNAATHLAWARRNPDSVKKQQAKTASEPERKFKALVTYAKSKGIEVAVHDADALSAKFSESCFYCDFTPVSGEKLNGLDRVDVRGGFVDLNTVPCCSTCNSIKASHSVDSFLHHARKMCEFERFDVGTLQSAVAPSGQARVLPASFGGRSDLRARNNAKEDDLTEAERVDLWASPCYLCGRGPSLGIDRLDSKGKYSSDNVKPCCSNCNYFKKDMTVSEVRTHVNYINAHTRMWVLGEDKLISHVGAERKPVAVYDETGAMRMAFPSMRNASEILGLGGVKAFVWSNISHATFFRSHFAHSVAKAFIQHARTVKV